MSIAKQVDDVAWFITRGLQVFSFAVHPYQQYLHINSFGAW